MSCGGAGGAGGAGAGRGGAGEEERPLKKARFAWQVKGRGRGRARGAPAGRAVGAGGAGPSSERSVEFLGDYLLKQNLNYWESLVERTLAERRDGAGAPGGAGGARRAAGPVSLVARAPDRDLERWQSVQITRGIIDNTINRVLDSWTFAPLPATDNQNVDVGNSWSQVLGVAEFINNLPGHNVENEGILMAISAHGLQNTPNSSIINGNYDENCNVPSRTTANELTETGDEENSNINMGNSINNESQCDAQAWRDLNRPCICSHTLRNSLENAEVRPLVPFHRRDPSTPYAYLRQPTTVDNSATVKLTPSRESESPESESSHDDNKVSTSSIDNMFDEHFDFMDTAVSFAIQNKGLTSYGADYG